MLRKNDHIRKGVWSPQFCTYDLKPSHISWLLPCICTVYSYTRGFLGVVDFIVLVFPIHQISLDFRLSLLIFMKFLFQYFSPLFCTNIRKSLFIALYELKVLTNETDFHCIGILENNLNLVRLSLTICVKSMRYFVSSFLYKHLEVSFLFSFVN